MVVWNRAAVEARTNLENLYEGNAEQTITLKVAVAPKSQIGAEWWDKLETPSCRRLSGRFTEMSDVSNSQTISLFADRSPLSFQTLMTPEKSATARYVPSWLNWAWTTESLKWLPDSIRTYGVVNKLGSSSVVQVEHFQSVISCLSLFLRNSPVNLQRHFNPERDSICGPEVMEATAQPSAPANWNC